MVPGFIRFNTAGAILFFAGGIAQVFWALPMIRKWGRPWYAIGIAGMAVFIAIWVTTRLPANPITGRGLSASPTGILTEVMEFAFIGLAAAILIMESRKRKAT